MSGFHPSSEAMFWGSESLEAWGLTGVTRHRSKKSPLLTYSHDNAGKRGVVLYLNHSLCN